MFPQLLLFNTFIRYALSYITLLSLCSSTLVVVGDFNLPDICWATLSGCSPSSILFCDCVLNCNLSQLVGSSTHIKGNVLDLVLTSDEEAVTSLKVHPGVDSPFKLDHFMVSFSLAVNTVCPSCSATSLVFDYSKADWEGLCGYLLDSDFSMCFEVDDVEEIWSVFKHIVFFCYGFVYS